MGIDPRLEDLFNRAVEIPREKREEFLRKACDGDESLFAGVMSLLRADVGPTVMLLRGSPVDRSLAASALEDRAFALEDPRVIGPYSLVRKLGEGGFGVVYLARQSEPIHRSVAIKILKPGMDSRQIVSRFETEREALALMQHPGIARVLDAGATPQGRSYFVMEYVPGLPITQFCDQRRLAIRQRLELFRKVCSAVQHAHEKGIVHRDLKPSNILVVEEGEVVTPKIIDFGISKALARDMPTQTVLTEEGQIMGTPEYMSPEQAEMTGQNIDARTDVYSLGVVLYEIVAGSTPIPREELLRSGIGGLQRVIQQREAPRPSTRVTADRAQLPHITDARRSTPAAIRGQIRGDLDWICLKAIDKDRTRRYASASELGADIERHLDNLPVVARPPTPGYLARKFVRRHRALVSATGVVLAALVIGLLATLWQLKNARAARDEAIAARAAAVANEADARAARVVAERREKDARFHQYAASIAAAEAALQSGDGPIAGRMLDQAPEALRDWEWRMLHARAHQELAALQGGAGPASSVAYSPDGATLAAGFSDGSVVLWDARTLQELRRWKASDQIVGRVAFSPDSAILASAGFDTVVRLWDPRSGEKLRELRSHEDHVHGIDFSPDGTRLLTADGGRWVIWDTGSGERLVSGDEQERFCDDLHFSPVDGRVALIKFDGRVDIFSPPDGPRETFALKLRRGAIKTTFALDGRLYIGGLDGVGVIDLVNRSTHLIPPAHGPFDVQGIAVNRTNTRLAASGSFGRLELRELPSERLIAELHGSPWQTSDARFSPDGKRIAAGCEDSTVRIWDSVPLDETSVIRVSSDGPFADGNFVDLSPDGTLLFACFGPGRFQVVDTRTSEIIAHLPSAADIHEIPVSPDGTLLAYDDGYGALRIVDAATGELVRGISIDCGQEHTRFSPD